MIHAGLPSFMGGSFGAGLSLSEQKRILDRS